MYEKCIHTRAGQGWTGTESYRVNQCWYADDTGATTGWFCLKHLLMWKDMFDVKPGIMIR